MQSVYTVCIRPVVTEKSMKAQEKRQYTVMVDKSATKIDIANAFSVMYSVEIESVNVIPVRKKTRAIGKTKVYTKRKAGKKAIVTIKEGQTLDLMKIEEEKKKREIKKVEKKSEEKISKTKK